ncbi:MAG: LysR substrate-binding domain-containing protein [Verrucomicrobia bacterium]|nr:LysR substrate-binding domain-containing protein [Verrucomicrobiota bacterium]
MELRHLRYFTAVAETLNFSRAAARLHITQPALSRQIRDLEHELGCALLRRGRNARTELTPEGARLLAGARKVLGAAEALTADIRAQAARLRIGHYGALWLDYFTPALRRFAKKHPAVGVQPVELSPGALPGALRRGEVEVALLGLTDAGLREEFETRLVAAEPAKLALAATHPLAKRRKLRLTDLREADWVGWDKTEFPGRQRLLAEACRKAGFRPRIVHETDSIASLLVRVATSEAVGYALPMVTQLPHQGVVFAECVPADAIVFEMSVGWRRGEPRGELIEKLVAELKAGRPRVGRTT